ncbi:hypothetical protein [Devosia sp. Leaf64]|jgi:hypothetical protein|uniref:hypothetical protein n=1 Tax=Devosia sp. Leaf64 TaxID=1736229 RepID=UPI0007136A9F|nr:hypothetical protein [Devosia sp. Leaf64]KQN73771.1 hypothetical protein ASE94_05845 [Devosia sp. Leaf64]
MRKLALGLLAAGLLATPVLAQSALTFADVDTDGDGRLSYEELVVVWPDLTQDDFARADIEGAGSVTPEQLGALQPAAVPAAPAPDAAVPAPEAVPAPAPMDAAPSPAPMDAVPALPGEGTLAPE